MIKIKEAKGFTAGQIVQLNHALAMANRVIATPEFSVLGEAARKLSEQEVSVEVRYYKPRWPWTKAIAYEADGVTYLNNKAFGSLSLLAGCLGHEATHALGFSHDFWATKARAQSQPYIVGDYIAAKAVTA